MTRLPCPPDERMDPLFPPVPTAAKPQRPPRQKPIAWGACPECMARPREALLQAGAHLIWRPHRYRTWSGADIDCRASGVALCHLGPAKGPVTNADGTIRTACRCLAKIGTR